MHVHLDHDNCLETVILRGPTLEVRRFAEQMTAERGVRHGQLNVIPVDADLPGVRKAHSTGQALERYIRDLLDGGLEDAARVVGTVYQGLLAHGLVRLPQGPSPLIPGETL